MRHDPEEEGVVFVVDDDASIRAALEDLLGSVGLKAFLFGSVQDFLRSSRPHCPACLVLDIRMPGMSGLDFQREMDRLNIQLPVIFITAHGDVPTSVRAMKAGAIEFLSKPFRDQDLLDAIQAGIEKNRAQRAAAEADADLRQRFETLNPRERDVMALVVTGLLNKEIAARLDVSEITVKVNRGQVMRKMHAPSLPALVRMADQLGLQQSAAAVRNIR